VATTISIKVNPFLFTVLEWKTLHGEIAIRSYRPAFIYLVIVIFIFAGRITVFSICLSGKIPSIRA
jgi:hypothetical protein